MRLECVTVCVNFSDVLAHTLPLNKVHFDDMVVVSDTGDVRTHNLCAHHHIRVIQTDHFYYQEQAFNKGNGINAGVAALSLSDWVLHIDADIVLPPRTREILNVASLDPECIYGIDRMMCPDYEAWMQHIGTPQVMHSDQTYIVPGPWPLGARVAKLQEDGYVPIGFFQLWNAARTGIKTYPNQHGTAGRTDMLFSLQWPRPKRVLLPELMGIHLEGRMRPGEKNWRGRRADWFGPTPERTPPAPAAWCGPSYGKDE
jgi:hypothetical protein